MGDKWQLRPLTARDRASTSLASVFNRTTPRPQAAWPVIRPRPLPGGGKAVNLNAPLNPLQHSMLGLMRAVSQEERGIVPGAGTIAEALHYLEDRMRRHR